ncbi:MAG: hypothetical protein ACTHME_08630 [Candidatus Nitrosocosmicus sp.]
MLELDTSDLKFLVGLIQTFSPDLHRMSTNTVVDVWKTANNIGLKLQEEIDKRENIRISKENAKKIINILESNLEHGNCHEILQISNLIEVLKHE